LERPVATIELRTRLGAGAGYLIEGSPQGRIRKGAEEWRVCRGVGVA